jgi:hypothetical protein
MKNTLLTTLLISVVLFSCSKKKYCYDCSAENNTSFKAENQCGLTEDDRDDNVKEFEAKYNSSHIVKCNKSED